MFSYLTFKNIHCIQVVKKTQLLAIGRQEAETEVFIDKIVGKLGGQEQALLYVTSEITSEPRVRIL